MGSGLYSRVGRTWSPPLRGCSVAAATEGHAATGMGPTGMALPAPAPKFQLHGKLKLDSEPGTQSAASATGKLVIPDPVRVSDGGRGPRECPMSGGEEKAERPVSTRNLGGQVTWSAQCSHCARMPLATGSTPRWGRMFCKVRRKDRALSMELVKLDSELAHSS